jgi:fucose 4-O-acetylase-like acetyltransferase
MERDKKIDALKGFAILLVVLGHAIQVNVPDFDNNLIFRIIYSFHMPLFMFLSGYIAFRKNEDYIPLITKKFKQLVIPFVCWYIFGYLFNLNLGFIEYLNRLPSHIDNGLWFLWVLFVNFILLGLILKCKNDLLILPAIIFLYLIPIPLLGASAWYFLFFSFGYLSGKYKKMPVQIGIIFPFIALTWYRLGDPTFWPYIVNIFSQYHLLGLHLLLLLYKLAVPLTGIALSFLIIRKSSLLSKLGLFTLDIYVVHQYLLGITFGQGWIRIVISSLVAMALSISLSFLLRKSSILSQLFLGKDFKKANI